MKPEENENIFTYLMKQDCEVMVCYDKALYTYFGQSIYKIKKQLRKERNLSDDFPWTAGPWDWLSDMRNGYPLSKRIASFSEIEPDINKIQFMQTENKRNI